MTRSVIPFARRSANSAGQLGKRDGQCQLRAKSTSTILARFKALPDGLKDIKPSAHHPIHSDALAIADFGILLGQRVRRRARRWRVPCTWIRFSFSLVRYFPIAPFYLLSFPFSFLLVSTSYVRCHQRTGSKNGAAHRQCLAMPSIASTSRKIA